MVTKNLVDILPSSYSSYLILMIMLCSVMGVGNRERVVVVERQNCCRILFINFTTFSLQILSRPMVCHEPNGKRKGNSYLTIFLNIDLVTTVSLCRISCRYLNNILGFSDEGLLSSPAPETNRNCFRDYPYPYK